MAVADTPEDKREKVLEKQVRTHSQRPSQERKRNVFNGTQGKITVNFTIDGYHLHGFNDEDGRIADALDGGYEFVSPEEVGGVKENVVSRNTDLGDKVRWLVGRTADGGPLYCLWCHAVAQCVAAYMVWHLTTYYNAYGLMLSHNMMHIISHHIWCAI